MKKINYINYKVKIKFLKHNINLANSYLEKIENLKNRVKVSLKNLSNSVDQNDETVFYIKYEDLINEINYIDV